MASGTYSVAPTYAGHITGNASHTITLSNRFQALLIQRGHLELTLVNAQSGSAPGIASVFGTTNITVTPASTTTITFTGGSAGSQYNIFSGEPFWID